MISCPAKLAAGRYMIDLPSETPVLPIVDGLTSRTVSVWLGSKDCRWQAHRRRPAENLRQCKMSSRVGGGMDGRTVTVTVAGGSASTIAKSIVNVSVPTNPVTGVAFKPLGPISTNPPLVPLVT